MFDVVLDEIDANPAFAERLAARLPDGLTLVVPARRKKPSAAPPELLALDLKAARAELGQIELRDRVSRHTNAELAAYVRAAGLEGGPLSKKNKTQLVNIIIRASK